MSEQERVELASRTKAMSEDEQKITAMFLPDELLWSELQRRYSVQNAMIKKIKRVVKEETE